MSRLLTVTAIVYASLLLLTAVPVAAAEAPGSPVTARVTYLTASSVYADAGWQDGLREGMEVDVVRDGQTIARLKVTFLSGHRASLSIVSVSKPPAVGDQVRFVPRGEALPSSAAPKPPDQGAPPSPKGPSRGGLAGLGIRGRAGVRYLTVMDRSENDAGFSQPALDLRLDGSAVGGSPLDLEVDVRARRTYRNLALSDAESERVQNHVYRMAASYHLDSRQRITVGRQFAPVLASLSIFDGLLYNFNATRWAAGGFTGVEPEDHHLNFSTEIREHGGYFQFLSDPQAQGRWAITTGLIGSYTQQTVDREFFYLQGQYFGKRLSAYLSQEVDYNRAWKVEEAGESTFSVTNTFANVHLRPNDRFALFVGYDNRRNVRLFRDRTTPETVFDDSHRQGGWFGASMRFGERFQAGTDVRSNSGGALGRHDSYSANFSVDRLTRAGLAFRTRTTRYTNERSEGWLHSLGTGVNLGSRFHLELSGGRLVETNLTDSTLDRILNWTGLDLDIFMGRRWYLLLSGERNHGNLETIDQAQASLTCRF